MTDPEAPPVVRLSQGIGEDPVHQAGRLDEYRHRQSNRGINLANETLKALRAEFLDLVNRTKRDMPSLFRRLYYPIIAKQAFPQRTPDRLDRLIEREYTQTPERIGMLPKTMAQRIKGKFHIENRRYAELLYRCQKVKKKLLQRDRDEQQRRACLGEPTP